MKTVRSPRDLIVFLVQLALLTLVYFSTARLGLGLDAVSGFATLFWLPTGISLAACLLFGYRILPGVFLGALFVNAAFGAPLEVALAIAGGNTAESLVGAFLLRRFVGPQVSLEQLKAVLGFILLAAAGSTLISATIGTVSLSTAGLLTASFPMTWSAWWLGDLISDLIVAPFILVWATPQREPFPLTKLSEGILAGGTVLLVGFVIFGGVFGEAVMNTPFTYLIFPPLIWLALRFSPRGVITAVFFLSLLAVWGVTSGYGPFVGTVSQRLFLLQSFMIVVSVTSLLLAAAVSERRRLEQRKDDFVSFASHELKTPLTSIKVFTGLMKKEVRKQTKTARFLNRLDGQVDKLVRLVNDMLDLPKIQAGTLEYRKERFSLPALITEIVETMQVSATGNAIIRRGRSSLMIYADRERIGQVVTNLISNAIKYSAPGAKIVIMVKTVEGRALVSIRDYGVGIPANEQEKIFDRFYRVTNAAMQTTPGLGIGLYLSSMIVKHHGGTISVKSQEKKGSTFSITLPLTEA